MASSMFRRIYPLILTCLLSLVLFACNNHAYPTTPTATNDSTPISPPTETASPPTPTPQADQVILWAPSSADPALTRNLQAMLGEAVKKSGLRFQVRQSLIPQEMPQVRAVVALPPEDNLSKQVAAYPHASFLAIGFSGLEPATNLTVVNTETPRPDQLGFLAGYIAAAITTDWRAGVLTAAGSEDGKAIRQGFANGVFFFCGLCRPVYPPFPTSGYPITIEIPAGNNPADLDAAITMLKSWQVGTVFVDPALSDEKFLTDLANAGINLILAGPPPAGARAHWVASLGSADPLQAIQSLLPSLLKGENNPTSTTEASPNSTFGITDSNPDLLSPGRKERVEEMLKDLRAGYIDTGASQTQTP